jgi:hypothetical protein
MIVSLHPTSMPSTRAPPPRAPRPRRPPPTSARCTPAGAVGHSAAFRPLLDSPVGGQQDRRRDRQAESRGGPQVNDQLELGRLLKRAVRQALLLSGSCPRSGRRDGRGQVRPFHRTSNPRVPPAPASRNCLQPSPGRQVHDRRSIGVGRPAQHDKERLSPGAADPREGFGAAVPSREPAAAPCPRMRKG